VMHAMGNVIDMRRFSGLRSVLPWTHGTFLVGALTLAGFPLLSGFWSKDEILDAAHRAGAHHGSAGIYYVFFLAGMLPAVLTAFSTFRANSMPFWGRLRVPREASAHGIPEHARPQGGGHAQATAEHAGHAAVHESPPVMTVPLLVLALFAAGIGAVVGPLTH